MSVNTLYSYDSYFPNYLYDVRNVYKALYINPPKYVELWPFENLTNTFNDLFIFSSQTHTNYDIKYKTCIDKLGLLGGLMYASISFIGLIIYFLIKNRFDEKIVNDLYTIINPKNEINQKKSFALFLKERYIRLS